MKRFLSLSLLMITVIVLSACGGARSQVVGGDGGGFAPSEPYFEYAPEMSVMPAMPAGMDMDFDGQGKASGGGGLAASAERMIIENAEIAVVVSDVEARMKEIQEMARGMGGHVVSSNLYKSYRNNVEALEATLTIRVPNGDLTTALGKIKEGAVEVQNESRSGQDVTSQYVDLQSRLKNLEAAERQLTEIMKDATETEDVVNIFNQLVYYREQIELVKGQMKYIEESAALSAITILLIAEDTIQPIDIGGWKPQGIARDAIQDLVNFWQSFVNFLIRFVIYTLPVWITVGVPLYLVFIGGRALFRKLRGGKAKPEAASVEPKEEKKK